MRHEFLVLTPKAKAELLTELGLAAADEPLVRDTAMALVRGLERWQHVDRLHRIQRFVAALPYYREPTEDFGTAAEILRRGGDCDDQALISVALCWALRYPAMAWPLLGDGDGWPGHFQTHAGYPEAESPEGADRTTWLPPWETTLSSSRNDGFKS